MAIIVKLFSNFRGAAGRKQTTVESAKNVRELLDKLAGEFGEKLAVQLYEPGGKNLRETVNILLNGRVPKELVASHSEISQVVEMRELQRYPAKSRQRKSRRGVEPGPIPVTQVASSCARKSG